MPAKPKTTSPAADPKLAQLAANVDEMGALEKELAPFAPKIARVEALRKAVRAHFVDASAAQPFEAKGAKFVVQVGPKANERSIDYAKLWKLAGVAVMRKIATVTLKALEAAVSAEIVAQVVGAPEPTGSRSLKVFERGAAS